MQALNRKIGTFALTMTGVGSIIGSGWLFGAWKAAKVAGPAAIFAWILGMGAILLIGLTYAELGAMFPVSGVPSVTHSIPMEPSLGSWLVGRTGLPLCP